MKTSIKISLISNWSANQPKFSVIECNLSSGKSHFDNSLFESYISKAAQPACGNKHAGKGMVRTVVNGENIECADEEKVNQQINDSIAGLGKRILVSAGHFMPLKKDFSQVNGNSFKSLEKGIAILKKILETGKQADLLITINDVTINSQDETDDSLPTMSAAQRSAFYANFVLPDKYIQSLIDLDNLFEGKFEIYVFGENRLSEKLNREATSLADEKYLRRPSDKSCYALSFDKDKLASIIGIAHGSGTDAASFYDLETPVFISNEAGLRGRPKCVRACAKLASLPYEMNYTGYVQFLPVCSRNALEGFLIGTEIYSRKYEKSIPYISIHDVFSCF